MTGLAASTARSSGKADVLALLDQMRKAARNPVLVRDLSDQLEVLVMAYLEPVVDDPVPGVKFTRCQRRIVARLMERIGQTVRRDSLMNAMYFDRPDEEPDIKIVDVLVCQIRKKLKESDFEIINDRGIGYGIQRIPRLRFI